MTSPLYDDGQATLYAGDALTVLRTLPSESVHVCVTSPPYFALRSYLPDEHPDKPTELGLEDTPEAYIARLVEVFREVRRVLHPSGTLWVNIGDSYSMSTRGAGGDGKQHTNQGSVLADRSSAIAPGTKPKDLLMIPAQLALALRADGWWLRSDIIWAKTAPMPESVTDRPTSAHEHVFLFAKQERYYYDALAIAEPSSGLLGGGFGPSRPLGTLRNDIGRERPPDNGSRNSRNVWTLGPDPFPGAHFATFPREIPRRAILAGSSERGVCGACGAPWARTTKHEYVKSPKHGAGSVVGRHYVTGANGWDGSGLPRVNKVVTTTGWQPTCTCAGPVVPAVVLDPFIGSGRTAAVAKSLGRRVIGIDLNAEYLRQFAVPQCQQQGLFFGEVA